MHTITVWLRNICLNRSSRQERTESKRESVEPEQSGTGETKRSLTREILYAKYPDLFSVDFVENEGLRISGIFKIAADPCDDVLTENNRRMAQIDR